MAAPMRSNSHYQSFFYQFVYMILRIAFIGSDNICDFRNRNL